MSEEVQQRLGDQADDGGAGARVDERPDAVAEGAEADRPEADADVLERLVLEVCALLRADALVRVAAAPQVRHQVERLVHDKERQVLERNRLKCDRHDGQGEIDAALPIGVALFGEPRDV